MKNIWRNVFLLLTFALATPLAAQDFNAILEQVDKLANFPDNDFAGEYTIVHDKPGQGRNTTVSAIFRRDSKKQYVIVVMEPDNKKGEGYLKQDQTLWFYDPYSRRFNSTSSRNRFQNSNARNSDFTDSTLAQDYSVVSAERVALGRFDCWLMELEANNDQVTYPYMRIWVDDDNLIRKSEDYSLSRQLLRATAVPDYQFVQGKAIPRAMLIIDMLEGANINGQFVNERTQITITKVSLDDLPNSVFTKAFLENVSQ